MKKAFLFIAAALMSTMMWAETTVDTIFLKGFAGSEATSYVSELLSGTSQKGIAVSASNFNPSTAQIKGNQTSATGNFYIYNTDAYPAAIAKIEIVAKIDASNYLKNNMYAATGTSSQAEVTDVAEGTAWTVETASWTFNEADGVTYFKLYSNEKFTNGSVKEAKVVVTYGGAPTPQRVLKSIYVDGTATKLEYFVGEEFDPAGLKVMGKYDTGDDAEIASGITWSFDPEVFALGNTSVAVTATYKDFTSEVFTVNSIVVKEKVVPTGYAGVYTSNVELSTEGGTSASAAKVIIDGDEYEAIKAGTGSVPGACVVTIPANTKTLHFHAAGWNKESVVLNESINLVTDAGVSGNSPFTLQNDPATQDYFTLDPKGATTVTFAATAGKRFVLFGVNAETGDTLIPPTKTLVSLEIGGEAAVLAYNVGDKFDVAGLTVTGTYDDASTDDVTSKVTWVINPETFAEASESASVEVTAKIGAIESAPIQVSGIVVTEKPAPVGGNTIVFEDYKAVSFTTSDGAYTVLAEKAGAGNPPVYNESGKDLRNYAKGTFTLTSNNENMTKIIFNLSAQGKKRQAEITPSVGAMAYDVDNALVTWTGNAAEVVFTVGEKAVYGTDGDSKAGQFDFVSVEITLGTGTGIREAMVNANVRKAMVNGRLIIVKGEKAFDLQGRIVK